MSKKAKGFSDQQAWEGFLQEFANGDDRTCALLSASLLDYWLEMMLLQAFVNRDEARQQLLADRMPLGTFSAKIELAYCLNLIPKFARDDLNLIRRIRNDFAHHLGALTFKENSLRSRCLELKTPRQYFSDELGKDFAEQHREDPRQVYMFATFILSKNFEIAYLEWAEHAHQYLSTRLWNAE